MASKKNVEKVEETKKTVSKDAQKQAVQELVELGKKQGELTMGDISSKLEAVEMDSEQIERIYDYIEKQGIEIVGNFGDEIPELEGDDDFEIIYKQWQLVNELPEVPGGYYIPRVIDQAFWNVVGNGKGIEEELIKWDKAADKEIAEKRSQYQ